MLFSGDMLFAFSLPECQPLRKGPAEGEGGNMAQAAVPPRSAKGASPSAPSNRGAGVCGNNNGSVLFTEVTVFVKRLRRKTYLSNMAKVGSSHRQGNKAFS
jgi:hypothetical protein